MITDIKAADKLVVVAPTITIWSARKKMQPDDYGIDKQSLPPDELCSLGVKKLCPPEKLRIFATLKARATNMLARYGIPFIPGSWLIPVDVADKVREALEGIRDAFNQAKTEFLAEYDAICSEWLSRHPEYSDMLRESMASPEYVRSRLSFAWRAFALKMTKHSNLQEEMQELGNNVFADIAREANAVQRDVFAGREAITHKALSPVRQLGEKLRGLSFVHPKVSAAYSLVQTCLEQMPEKGNIEGTQLGMVMALITLLGNPVALEDCTDRMLAGTGAVELLMPVMPEATPEAAPEAEVCPIVQQPVIANVGLW